MKKRMQTAMILAALICMSISGCSERTVTPKSTSVTEPMVKISVTSATTVTTEDSVSEVTEKSTIPSTVVESTTNAVEVVAVTTLTAPQTETPKVEIEQPQIQISTEYYEPTEATIAVVTDDTKLTHAEFCNAENMNRVASGLVDYYIAKGMKYDSSISTNNSGWMYVYQGQVDGQAVRSYNEHWERIVIGMDEQLEAFMTMYPEAKYTDLSFNCYEELQPDGEYDIYFCYK
ncbi:MAG: hypothetical protein IJ298_09030 [Ruminococcus sp.]|nr:hypothetical protein [Ruminococcus sp.]